MKQLTVWATVSGVIVLGAAGCDKVTEQQGGLSWNNVAGVAQSITRNEDHTAVKDLANWIIQEKGDFVLIDVRDSTAYQAGHIDTARSLPLTDLLSAETLAELEGDRKIILYSQQTADAAQAAALLRLANIDAYSLMGGYKQWLRHMTDPGPAGADDDARTRSRHQAVQCFFEGDYVAEAGLIVKMPPGAGFTPPLQAVEEDKEVEDPLGLGLGLETEPESVSEKDTGHGLGGGSAPAGLKIGEGC
ncbi:MAG: rhodanese-like domain-containing protein [Pseudomonadota bacterium]|nr:rhodanese-like domain-containing protein [Pseudomonadota bacterium]